MFGIHVHVEKWAGYSISPYLGAGFSQAKNKKDVLITNQTVHFPTK
jgi:hypothetical protein